MQERKRFWILCFVVGVWQGEPFAPSITTQTSRTLRPLPGWVLAFARKPGEEDSIVDAIIEDPDDGKLSVDGPRKRKRDMVRSAFKRLTELSLADYEWRSSVFKEKEADRRVEESLARMMGEDPSYVRPMDASENSIGPLGRAEQSAVKWLSRVIEEEGKRAEAILNKDGRFVRPIDSASGSSEPGPLAEIEQGAVDFVNKIRDSEKARVQTGTFRPKDMEESTRGPLGNAEEKAVGALREILKAEELRLQQSKVRKGEIVRPIDVPGPLGEFERAIGELVRAEQQRAKDFDQGQGELVRPKDVDASMRGPLGDAEEKAVEAFARLTQEERERLINIQRYLQEKRPMEADRNSPLGLVEAVAVGMLRAPRIMLSVVDRVKELMASEALEEEDQEVLKLKSSSDEVEKDDLDDSFKEPNSNN